MAIKVCRGCQSERTVAIAPGAAHGGGNRLICRALSFDGTSHRILVRETVLINLCEGGEKRSPKRVRCEASSLQDSHSMACRDMAAARRHDAVRDGAYIKSLFGATTFSRRGDSVCSTIDVIG